MKYSAGVDVGSTQTKAVIIDEHRQIVARALTDTGANVQQAAQTAFDAACDDGKIDPRDVKFVIGTGYGRFKVTFGDKQVTEISCHGRGAVHMFPMTGTVIDMGGQDSKASRIDDSRKVRTFRLNDKCASGTGMFLEKTVRYMGFDTEDIDGLLENATEPASISGVCTVFAESEVINHLSNSVSPENIMFGAGMSLTSRSVQLLKRVKIEEQLTLVGGILRWGRIAQAISEDLKMEVNVAEGDMPQFVAALGCAILGQVRLKSTDRSKSAPSMAAVGRVAVKPCDPPVANAAR
jgi:predicted CoA-substrate-specific enzyme activase